MIIFSSLRLSFRAWVIILCVSSVSDILIQWGRKLSPSFIIPPLITPPKVSPEPVIGQALSVLAAHWSKSNHFECILSKPLWQGCKRKLQSLRNWQFNKYFLVNYEQKLNMFAKKLTLIPVKASSLIFEN